MGLTRATLAGLAIPDPKWVMDPRIAIVTIPTFGVTTRAHAYRRGG